MLGTEGRGLRPPLQRAGLTHDVQAGYNAPWNATSSLGAGNLTDKASAYDVAYSPTNCNDEPYNGYGHQLYLRYTQNL